MSGEEILNSPAYFFINKLDVYRLFSIKTLFSLRIIKKNTKDYIDAISANFKDKIIKTRKIDNLHSFDVTNAGDLTEKVIPFFQKYPLLSESKKRNFYS